MNFARVHHDHVAGPGVDSPNAAPGPLRTEGNQSHAKLIVSMPRKVVV